MVEEDEEEINKEHVTNELQALGFNQNDSRVYIALLQLQVASPTEIADLSGVERSRVYDSLKRLEQHDAIESESAKRPRFRPRPPEEVMGKIRRRLNRKIDQVDDLEERLKKIPVNPMEIMGNWALDKRRNIQKSLDRIIEEATDTCYLICPEHLSFNEVWALKDALLQKKKENPDIDIKLGLRAQLEYKNVYSQLFHAGIDLKHSGEVYPFGLAISKHVLFTILTETELKPEYNFGMFFENPSDKILGSFCTLAAWYFKNFCKEIVFTPKK